MKPTLTNWEGLKDGTTQTIAGQMKVTKVVGGWLFSVYYNGDCSTIVTGNLNCTYGPGTGFCEDSCDLCGECASLSYYTYCNLPLNTYIYDDGVLSSGSGGHAHGSTPPFTDPSGYVFDPNLPATGQAFTNIQNATNFWNALTNSEQGWADNHRDFYKILIDKMINDYNSESVTFTDWAVEYLTQHPEITFEIFQNQYLIPEEGADGFYDAQFWENPNLNFPQQALPSLADFEAAYPTYEGDVLVPEIGGAVAQAYADYPQLNRGFCALKVSRGLNYSGVTIPQITTTSNNPGTLEGADGKFYFVNAKALNKWMRETFGTNPSTASTPYNASHSHYTAAQAGTNGQNLNGLLSGLTGIYSMVSTNPNWASGHADLLYTDATCTFGCHFDGPIDYYRRVDIKLIFILL